MWTAVIVRFIDSLNSFKISNRYTESAPPETPIMI